MCYGTKDNIENFAFDYYALAVFIYIYSEKLYLHCDFKIDISTFLNDSVILYFTKFVYFLPLYFVLQKY